MTRAAVILNINGYARSFMPRCPVIGRDASTMDGIVNLDCLAIASCPCIPLPTLSTDLGRGCGSKHRLDLHCLMYVVHGIEIRLQALEYQGASFVFQQRESNDGEMSRSVTMQVKQRDGSQN
jgi:hypothetical protein